MTHVILGILGILLAAASALITIDYGGDYFIESQHLANSAVLQSAGQHVQTAYDLHERRFGTAPSNVTALVSRPGYRAFLTSLPLTNGEGGQNAINANWVQSPVGPSTYNMLVIENVPTGICRAVNKRVNSFANPEIIPSATAFREGCVNNVAGQPSVNNTYYRYMKYP